MLLPMNTRLTCIGIAVLSVIVTGCSRSGEPVEYENIYQAALHGDVDALQGFMDEGISVNHVTNNGTALHGAVRNDQVEAVEFLLANGADVSIRQPRLISDEAPIHTAASNGNETIVGMLIQNGADVNTRKSLAHISGLTPLHEAVLSRNIHEGHMATVMLLIEHGADVNAEAIMGDERGTPLGAALQRNHEGIAEILKSYGARK